MFKCHSMPHVKYKHLDWNTLAERIFCSLACAVENKMSASSHYQLPCIRMHACSLRNTRAGNCILKTQAKLLQGECVPFEKVSNASCDRRLLNDLSWPTLEMSVQSCFILSSHSTSRSCDDNTNNNTLVNE